MNDVPPRAPLTMKQGPLDRLMIVAVTALAFTIAASCVSIVFDTNRLSVLSHLMSDTSSGDLIRLQSDLAAAHTSDSQTSAIAIVELVTFVISGVCFIAWFHRAYSNLLSLGATSTRPGTGWAIGAWFVPILNLWRPKQIANDIWRGTDPRHPRQQPSWREPVSPLLWLWWGAFLLLGILNRAVAEDWTSAATAHAIRSATRLDMATEATSIIAAVLTISVVRTLTRRQSQRARADRSIVAASVTG
jgi:uncharacterized protein DUF4328